MTLSLVICGAFGRMGQTVIGLSHEDPQFSIVGGTVRKIANKNEPCAFLLHEDLEPLLAKLRERKLPPIIIDFSESRLASRHLSLAKSFGSPLLLATTGHHEGIHAELKEAAKTIPVVFAPNTSLMASLMLELTEVLARSLGDSEISIIDLHHAHKKDAPSGTANALLNAINKARAHRAMSPTVHSLRHGTVAGEHTVCFFNQFERLEIVHRVENRKVFAQGALVAAQFLSTAGPGLYGMKDVLKMNLAIEI